jgi:diamine N-acetyltransferase
MQLHHMWHTSAGWDVHKQARIIYNNKDQQVDTYQSAVFILRHASQQMVPFQKPLKNPSAMLIQTKNNKQVLLSTLGSNDLEGLLCYLDNLSGETRKRFGPHPFDKAAVIDFYKNPESHLGFVALDTAAGAIIAYAIIKTGYLQHDSDRLQSYGIELSSQTDCTFAPSVADAWQGLGIGNSLLHFIIAELKPQGFKRIILWGGVQADNTHAVHYYTKNGFSILGQFEYNGPNYDMVFDIHE